MKIALKNRRINWDFLVYPHLLNPLWYLSSNISILSILLCGWWKISYGTDEIGNKKKYLEIKWRKYDIRQVIVYIISGFVNVIVFSWSLTYARLELFFTKFISDYELGSFHHKEEVKRKKTNLTYSKKKYNSLNQVLYFLFIMIAACITLIFI